jgi:hypothetical protein
MTLQFEERGRRKIFGFEDYRAIPSCTCEEGVVKRWEVKNIKLSEVSLLFKL